MIWTKVCFFVFPTKILLLGEAKKKKEPTKGTKGFGLEKMGPSSHNMRK
jgi:hypothetical protein